MVELFPDLGTIRFVKSRDAGAILNATVAFARRNAREFVGQFLLLTAPFVIVSGLATSLWAERLGPLFEPGAGPEAVEQLEGVFGSGFLVTLLVGFLSFAVTQAVVAAYVRLYRDGEQGGVSLGLLWAETWPLLLPVTAITLFVLALYLASLIVAALLGAVSWVLLLLWVAFWIWLAPYLHVAYASRMLEAGSVVEATARAAALVRGAWPTAAGAVWGSWLIAIALLFLINIPVGVVVAVVEANSVSGGAGLGWTDALSVPFMVLSYVAYALPAVAAFFLHGRLSADLDGADVEAELDLLDLAAEAAPGADWGEGAASGGPDAEPASSPPPPREAPDHATPPPSESPRPRGEEQGSAAPQNGGRGFRGGGWDG